MAGSQTLVDAWMRAIALEHQRSSGTGEDPAGKQLKTNPMCHVLTWPKDQILDTIKFTLIQTFDGAPEAAIETCLDGIWADTKRGLAKADFRYRTSGAGKGWDFWVANEGPFQEGMKADAAAIEAAHGNSVACAIIGRYETVLTYKRASKVPFLIKAIRKHIAKLDKYAGEDKAYDKAGKETGDRPSIWEDESGGLTTSGKELKALGGVELPSGERSGAGGLQAEHSQTEENIGGIGGTGVRGEMIMHFVETGSIEWPEGSGIMRKAPKAVKEHMRIGYSKFKQKLGYEVNRDILLTKEGKVSAGFPVKLVLIGTVDNQARSAIENDATKGLQNHIEDLIEWKGDESMSDLLASTTLQNLVDRDRKFITITGDAKPKKVAKSSSKGKADAKIDRKIPFGRTALAGVTARAVKALMPSQRANKAARTARRDPASSSVPLEQIRMLINKDLPNAVADNMGKPRLTYRTGEFARSVKIEYASKTKGGFPSFAYTYQRDPYQKFEHEGDYDPRPLIDQSIRGLAAKHAMGRFYTRRA